MNGKFVLVIIMVITLVSLVGAQGNSPKPREKKNDTLLLKVSKLSEATRVVPPSRLYVAHLINHGSRPISLEGVQMPGGYIGSGRFFACSLKEWHSNDRRRKTIREAAISDFGRKPKVIVEQVQPGDEIEVCRMMLPSQGGTAGQCAAFSLRSRWNPAKNETLEVVSEPFVIDASKEKLESCK